IVVTAIAIAWMLAYFARSGARHPVLPVALGLVIGGSASNLADRVRLGFVTDFLDFRYWPAFHLADSFIVIGVGILLAALAGAEGGEEDRPGIVHRLDRDTSGLLVVARSHETYERLQRLVRRRALTREYLALVVGRPRSRRGTIDAPIGRDRHDRLRHSL